MKQGDKFEVKIEGQVVAEAEVREVGDGQVTLVVPGTIVVMAVETSLAPATPVAPAPAAPAAEHQILGVDRVSNASAGNGGVAAGVEGASETGSGSETPQPAGIPVSDPGETIPNAPETQTPAQEAVAQPETSPVVSDDSSAEPNA